jgi:hypothetical protein
MSKYNIKNATSTHVNSRAIDTAVLRASTSAEIDHFINLATRLNQLGKPELLRSALSGRISLVVVGLG